MTYLHCNPANASFTAKLENRVLRAFVQMNKTPNVH